VVAKPNTDSLGVVPTCVVKLELQCLNVLSIYIMHNQLECLAIIVNECFLISERLKAIAL